MPVEHFRPAIPQSRIERSGAPIEQQKLERARARAAAAARRAQTPAERDHCSHFCNHALHLVSRVIVRRLPPSAERSGSSRFDPVGPSSTAMTRPLCSTGITPLQRYYGAVRPSPAHRYFRPCGWNRLCLFPWHRRPGSHVPSKSLIELRAAYMPDAAWAVSGHPPG
jgi:hypothetical protein